MKRLRQGASDDSSLAPAKKIKETEKAILLEPEGEGSDKWFPKSEVFAHGELDAEGAGFFDIPNWLLDKKGW